MQKKYQWLHSLKRTAWIMLTVAAILQIYIEGSRSNSIGILVALLTWFVTDSFLLKEHILKKYTISLIPIIGFILTQVYFPLIFMTFEWKPITFNLEMPEWVFFHNAGFSIIFIGIHKLYQQTKKTGFVRLSWINKVYNKCGIYQPAGVTFVWFLGFVGLLSTTYVYFVLGDYNGGVDGVGRKLLDGLKPLIYAPFFLPISNLFSTEKKDNLFFLLLLYFIPILGLGIGANSRGLIVVGVMSLVIAYFIDLALNGSKKTIFSIKNCLLVLSLSFIVFGPLTDLALAMVIVRNQRYNLSASKLFKKTYQIAQKKEVLQKYYKKSTLKKSSKKWDESYLNNLFLARFCNIKFTDLTLNNAKKLTPKGSEKFRVILWKRLLGAFPSPLLDFFNIRADKSKIMSASPGDWLYYLAGGPNHVIGGFRVSQAPANAIAAYGYELAILLYMLSLFLLFYILDAFIYKGINITQVSFILLLESYNIFKLLIQGSPFDLAVVMIRTIPELIFLYVSLHFIFQFLRKTIQSVRSVVAGV